MRYAYVTGATRSAVEDGVASTIPFLPSARRSSEPPSSPPVESSSKQRTKKRSTTGHSRNKRNPPIELKEEKGSSLSNSSEEASIMTEGASQLWNHVRAKLSTLALALQERKLLVAFFDSSEDTSIQPGRDVLALVRQALGTLLPSNLSGWMERAVKPSSNEKKQKRTKSKVPPPQPLVQLVDAKNLDLFKFAEPKRWQLSSPSQPVLVVGKATDRDNLAKEAGRRGAADFARYVLSINVEDTEQAVDATFRVCRTVLRSWVHSYKILFEAALAKSTSVRAITISVSNLQTERLLWIAQLIRFLATTGGLPWAFYNMGPLEPPLCKDVKFAQTNNVPFPTGASHVYRIRLEESLEPLSSFSSLSDFPFGGQGGQIMSVQGNETIFRIHCPPLGQEASLSKFIGMDTVVQVNLIHVLNVIDFVQSNMYLKPIG